MFILLKSILFVLDWRKKPWICKTHLKIIVSLSFAYLQTNRWNVVLLQWQINFFEFYWNILQTIRYSKRSWGWVLLQRWALNETDCWKLSKANIHLKLGKRFGIQNASINSAWQCCLLSTRNDSKTYLRRQAYALSWNDRRKHRNAVWPRI